MNNYKHSSNTRSCEDLFCFDRCKNNSEKTVDKNQTLDYHYIEKLSLKKMREQHHDSVYAQNRMNNSSFFGPSLSNLHLRQNPSINHHQGAQQLQKSPKCHPSSPCNQQGRLNRTSSQRNIGNANQSYCSGNYFKRDEMATQNEVRCHQQNPKMLNTDRSESKNCQRAEMGNYYGRKYTDKPKGIQELRRLRHQLELEIVELDQSIEEYYEIYNKKLSALKDIQGKMVERAQILPKQQGRTDNRGAFSKKSSPSYQYTTDDYSSANKNLLLQSKGQPPQESYFRTIKLNAERQSSSLLPKTKTNDPNPIRNPQ